MARLWRAFSRIFQRSSTPADAQVRGRTSVVAPGQDGS
jgi:hypothetical protein